MWTYVAYVAKRPIGVTAVCIHKTGKRSVMQSTGAPTFGSLAVGVSKVAKRPICVNAVYIHV